MIKSSIVFGLAFVLSFSNAAIGASDPCQKYYGKGYCTDYVNKMIGEKIRGDADRWRANITAAEVKEGDVAIFRSKKHVAFIEKVVRRDDRGRAVRIRVSEMNWGRRSPSAPAECWVTTNFNRVTQREISVSGLEFYQPARNRGSRNKNSIRLPDPKVGETKTTTPMYLQ